MDNVEKLKRLQPREREALMDLAARLHQEFSYTIRHMLLFGSKVRGDSDAESDIDLLIVVDEYSWDLETEILRLLTHGLVHLMGLDHERSEAEEKEMLTLEVKLLAALGLKEIYPP